MLDDVSHHNASERFLWLRLEPGEEIGVLHVESATTAVVYVGDVELHTLGRMAGPNQKVEQLTTATAEVDHRAEVLVELAEVHLQALPNRFRVAAKCVLERDILVVLEPVTRIRATGEPGRRRVAARRGCGCRSRRGTRGRHTQTCPQSQQLGLCRFDMLDGTRSRSKCVETPVALLERRTHCFAVLGESQGERGVLLVEALVNRLRTLDQSGLEPLNVVAFG